MMKRKVYTTPTTELIEVHTVQPLLLMSGTGNPLLGTDTIDYDGVDGSFGADEEVGSRTFDDFW